MATHDRTTTALRRFPLPVLIVGAVALVVVLVVFGRFCSSAVTINVTVNGSALSLHGAKNMETAIRESGLPINPGDLISLNGVVLKKSAGYPFYATVNGTETVDPAYQLHNGDDVKVRDGKDKVEDFDATESPLSHSAKITGLGAIGPVVPGSDGVLEHRTGRLSGETAEHVKVQPVSAECARYNPNVGDDKVIVLTFDEGPSKDFTADILDILKENDAKATFFCQGKQVESNPDLVRRERDEGHQVCTGTYSLSWSAILNGKSNGSCDAATMKEEVEHGLQTLSDALDGSGYSRCVRMPVSELSGEIVGALDTTIQAEISWNVDSGDRIVYSSDQIYNVLTDCESGDVVLLHDGGGDRSATVEALRRAIPKLKSDGYSFITIDELMRYPVS